MASLELIGEDLATNANAKRRECHQSVCSRQQGWWP